MLCLPRVGRWGIGKLDVAVDGHMLLRQLTVGSAGSGNNQYSRQVGQRVLNAREAAKEAAKAETDDEDYSFSKAVMDQLLGRG